MPDYCWDQNNAVTVAPLPPSLTTGLTAGGLLAYVFLLFWACCNFQWGSHGGMYMPDYYWDQNNAVPVDYLCSQWFLRPEWLQYMWVSAGSVGGSGR